MIHSLCGGTIKNNDLKIFVKVELSGEVKWYLSPFPEVKVEDRVLVFSHFEVKEGKVIFREEQTALCAPVPMNRIEEILQIVKT